MSDEEINIAIAEACGWAHPNVEPYAFPDYCNDLNAMHEAEKILNDKDRRIFANQLSQIHDASYKKAWWDLDSAQAFELAHSTARQRAEAFLRVVGKWKEDTK